MITKILTDANGMIGVGVKFERIRRITGYLVGTLDRFNNAKRSEESQRVKHMSMREQEAVPRQEVASQPDPRRQIKKPARMPELVDA